MVLIYLPTNLIFSKSGIFHLVLSGYATLSHDVTNLVFMMSLSLLFFSITEWNFLNYIIGTGISHQMNA